MEITSTVKRKKRRTRKCLDEIRKRSQRSTFGELSQTKAKNFAIPSDKYIITSKRLTLEPNGFSKAVKSETITRPPTLSKTQTDEANNKKKIIVSNTSNTPLDPKNVTPLQNESQFHKERATNRENVTPESILFSPVAALSTSASSHNLLQDSGSYSLYAQFLKEIPFHIEQNSPHLINKNVMKKTKTFLQNVYTEGCRRESDKQFLLCMTNRILTNDKRSETPESIIQDPLDYIKRGALRKRAEQEEVSAACSPRSSPSSPSSLVPTPLADVQDTPEYTYYPRKLNR